MAATNNFERLSPASSGTVPINTPVSSVMDEPPSQPVVLTNDAIQTLLGRTEAVAQREALVSERERLVNVHIEAALDLSRDTFLTHQVAPTTALPPLTKLRESLDDIRDPDMEEAMHIVLDFQRKQVARMRTGLARKPEQGKDGQAKGKDIGMANIPTKDFSSKLPLFDAVLESLNYPTEAAHVASKSGSAPASAQTRHTPYPKVVARSFKTAADMPVSTKATDQIQMKHSGLNKHAPINSSGEKFQLTNKSRVPEPHSLSHVPMATARRQLAKRPEFADHPLETDWILMGLPAKKSTSPFTHSDKTSQSQLPCAEQCYASSASTKKTAEMPPLPSRIMRDEKVASFAGILGQAKGDNANLGQRSGKEEVLSFAPILGQGIGHGDLGQRGGTNEVMSFASILGGFTGDGNLGHHDEKQQGHGSGGTVNNMGTNAPGENRASGAVKVEFQVSDVDMHQPGGNYSAYHARAESADTEDGFGFPNSHHAQNHQY